MIIYYGDCKFCGTAIHSKFKKNRQRIFCSQKCLANSRRKPIEFTINQNGCFECTSHAQTAGYPYLNGEGVYRHIYRFYKGEIPKGKVVRHTCDNRLCINPQHLLIGTLRDNIQDAIDRKRHRRGVEHSSAKLNVEQVRFIRDNDQIPRQEISKRFGIKPCTVSNIRKRRIWKDVV